MVAFHKCDDYKLTPAPAIIMECEVRSLLNGRQQTYYYVRDAFKKKIAKNETCLKLIVNLQILYVSDVPFTQGRGRGKSPSLFVPFFFVLFRVGGGGG